VNIHERKIRAQDQSSGNRVCSGPSQPDYHMAHPAEALLQVQRHNLFVFYDQDLGVGAHSLTSALTAAADPLSYNDDNAIIPHIARKK
jgi:hypothetical protein